MNYDNCKSYLPFKLSMQENVTLLCLQYVYSSNSFPTSCVQCTAVRAFLEFLLLLLLLLLCGFIAVGKPTYGALPPPTGLECRTGNYSAQVLTLFKKLNDIQIITACCFP